MCRWIPILLLLASMGRLSPLRALGFQDPPPKPVVAPSTAQLTVRVIGKASRAPVVGIRVSLDSSRTMMGGRSRPPEHEVVDPARGDLTHDPITGTDGVVFFSNVSGYYGNVQARGETGAGYLKDVFLNRGEPRELVLELAQGDDAHVVGRVEGPEWDQPVPYARICVLEVGDDGTPSLSWTPREYLTNRDGGFEFDYPSWKNIYMRVEADGCSPGIALPCDRLTNAKALSLIHLNLPAVIDARVVDTAGTGVADVEVRALVDARELAGQSDFAEGRSARRGFTIPLQEWTCKTDATGRALLTGLPRMRLKFDVCKDGRVLRDEPGIYRVPPQGMLALEFKIGGHTQVNGLVLDQTGKPVVAAEIWLERWENERGRYPQGPDLQRTTNLSAKTDDAGRFVMHDVLPGKWWIGPAPTHSDETPRPPSDVIGAPKMITTDLAPGSEVLETNGEPSLELTLHVARSLYVRGIVLSTEGKPLANWRVRATDAKSLFWGGGATGPDGRFTIGPVPPHALYLISTRTNEHAQTDFVEVRAGDPDVTLHEQPSSCLRAFVTDTPSIQGLFTEIMVRPLEAAPGVVRTLGTPADYQSWSNEDTSYCPPDGHFSRRFVQPGKYAIGAARSDGRFAFATGIEAPAGGVSEEVVLNLKPGGTLRVMYRGKEMFLYVNVSAEGVSLRRGSGAWHDQWTVFPAPSGRFQLDIRKTYDGPARTKAVELKPGETKEITLTDED